MHLVTFRMGKKLTMTKQIFIVLLFTIISFSVEAQSSKPTLETGTVENQFDYLITESERFKEFQVVNRRWLRKVKAQVLDTLKDVRTELSNTQNLVNDQKKEIDALKTELEETNGDLTDITNKKNSISIFGQNIPKGTYNAIMWSIIGGLLAFLLLYIMRFNRSHAVISKTQEALDRTRTEYDSFRERMLKREQELGRKLQDEINRNTNL